MESPVQSTSQQPAAASAANPAVQDRDAATFPIVGIGASAGGLEAFTEFLEVLPADTGMAFVFIQDLGPKHVNILKEFLQRQTKMPVEHAVQGLEVRPDHVYLTPGNVHTGVNHGTLTLSPRLNSPIPHMPIDAFLCSLAKERRSKAIGVILSGLASDGALGIRAIKGAGGITFAQNSETAKYNGMPRAAFASGCIDFVLAPQDIARELTHLREHSYISLRPSPADPEKAPEVSESLRQIVGYLQNATGVDFSFYKTSMVRRRILRRMALRQTEDLALYATRLRSDPAELQALYNDILIHVTEFFRDPEVFEELKTVVFPNIAPIGQPVPPVRIWVPGCASGEEVYSIAIAFLEYLGERRHAGNVQIFGTDINDIALNQARSGTFAPSFVQDISTERMRRFFTKVDSHYRISEHVREMCVFARQNLIKDPPFSKLNLISCRNVLVYLGAAAQRHVVPVLHYALKRNGYLLLGSSESIGSFEELFSLEDKQAKIYRRRESDVRHNTQLHIKAADVALPPDRPLPGDWSDMDLLHEADRIVLGKYGPAGVVVDNELNVVQFRGRITPFLEPPTGVASLNLLKLARAGLSVELWDAVCKAQTQNAPVRREGLRVPHNSDFLTLNVEVIPFQKIADRDPRYLILFEEVQPAVTPAPDAKAKKRSSSSLPATGTHRLRQELLATKTYLQSVIRELEFSKDHLLSANEEIRSSNEKLQNRNEEIEAMKEELQSSSEELNTVNEELQTRNFQFAQLGNDLLNLLDNVNIPIIMVGNDLCIRRFTPVSQRLLNLTPTDVGRPIGDMNLNLDITGVDRIAAEVIDTLAPHLSEVKDLQGRPYSLRIRPYRTEDNRVDGAVIVLVDLNSRANTEFVAERAMTGDHRQADRAQNEELRAFSAGLLTAQENERRNLALELHDDLGQSLALLELSVESLERSNTPRKQWREDLHAVHEQIKSLSSSLRQIAYQLHPAALEHLGLAEAVESHVRQFNLREKILVRFQASNVPGDIDPQTALSLYRIVQESLSNIVKHSNAKSAEILLSRSEHTIRLRIKDSGSGFEFESSKNKGGLGLRSMEERTRACGGTFQINAKPGAGTEVLVEVPEIGTQNVAKSPGHVSN